MICDWIIPLWGIFQDIRHDPTLMQTGSWTFLINYHNSIRSGWNANRIQRMLRDQGIETWGGQTTGGKFFFRVYREDAQHAEYLMLRYGIPIWEKLLGAPGANDKRDPKIDTMAGLNRVDKKIGDIERKIDRYRNPGHIQDW